MKAKLLTALVATAIAGSFSGSVLAADADAAEALAKKSGCTKCHAVDKSKKGPSYNKIAAKWKGKADAEAKLIDNITKAPKVKFEDGTEEEHKVVESKDPKEIKNLVQWILSR
ncbi:MAG TPA: c-type cytochrome [Usitatibacteraceae bacterium]|nr:c-type cytochrome [Usitatibacteraceae bacterium]